MKKLIRLAVLASICCLSSKIASAAPWCDASDWAAADAACKAAGLGCATAADDGCPNYSGGAVHCHAGALVAGGTHPRTDAKADKAVRSDIVGKFAAKAAPKKDIAKGAVTPKAAGKADAAPATGTGGAAARSKVAHTTVGSGDKCYCNQKQAPCGSPCGDQ